MTTTTAPTTSLYQRCVDLVDQLSLVPTFKDTYFANAASSSSYSSSEQQTSDPVTLLWSTFRVGSSLCLMLNHLVPGIVKNVHSPSDARHNPNLAKTNVYYFLLECRRTLGFAANDLFGISDVFKDDTNGFVKVLHTVELVVQRMQVAKRLMPFETNRSSSSQPMDRQLSERPIVQQSRKSMDGKTHREKIVMELLETERKYVSDLELLHNYMNLLQQREIISVHDIRSIFSNLSTMLDLQRKFLIGLEQVCIQPLNQQLLGSLFVRHEEAFAVYGPYCANHSHANDTVLRVKDALMQLDNVMEPTRQLASYLIRPVQRICKYPLLLKELVRVTPADLVDDLNSGYATMSRVTSMINEISRAEENRIIAKQLEHDVEDWKGYDFHQFGDLLLNARLIMSRKNEERPVHVFLFENVLICCKESKKSSERSSRGISRILSGGSSGHLYSLKGGVRMVDFHGIVASSKEQKHELKVFYREVSEIQTFMLLFLNEEILTQWQSTLERLLDLTRRRSAPINHRDRQQRRSAASNDMSTSARSSPISSIQQHHRVANSMIMTRDNNSRNQIKQRAGFGSESETASERGSLASSVRSPLMDSRRSHTSAREDSPIKTLPDVPENVPMKNSRSALTHIQSRLNDMAKEQEQQQQQSKKQLPPHAIHYEALKSSTPASRRSSNKSETISNLDNAMSELGEVLKQRVVLEETRPSQATPPSPFTLPKPPRHAPPPVPLPQMILDDDMSRASLPTPFTTPEPVKRQTDQSTPEVSVMMKAKVHFGEDIFLIFVPTSVKFQDLVRRLCDKLYETKSMDERRRQLDSWAHKVTYCDEDGDFITLRGDEDMSVAVKLALAGAAGKRPQIHLHVQVKL